MNEEIVEIAEYLLPHKLRDSCFWKENYAVIRTLSITSGILMERKCAFKKNGFKRDDAITLIVFADLAWQKIRLLSEKKGNDLDWLKDFIPDGMDGVYAEHKCIVEEMKWVFDLHSVLRHPENDKIKDYYYMYAKTWPEGDAKKLLSAVDNIYSVFSIFDHEFNEESGWESDIEEKRKLANAAREVNDK